MVNSTAVEGRFRGNSCVTGIFLYHTDQGIGINDLQLMEAYRW